MFCFINVWVFLGKEQQMKEIRKRQKERKEGKKGKKGKTDRKKVRERKGKGKRVNKLWQTFYVIYIYIYIFVIFVCYWAKNNPTSLSQDTENLVFKILRNLFL